MALSRGARMRSIASPATLFVLCGCLAYTSAGIAQAQEASQILPSADTHRLIVKFHDEARARASRGELVLTGTNTRMDAAITSFTVDHAALYTQLVELDNTMIDRIDGKLSPSKRFDIRSMLEVHVEGVSLFDAARELRDSRLVEWVSIEPRITEPPCEDIRPQTIDFVNLQGYTMPEIGINIQDLQRDGRATGEGITVANIEYYFNPDHEDLCNVETPWSYTIPEFVFQNGWDNHGTAALGVLIAKDNDYGVTGLVPHANAAFFPEYTVENGSNRATAILRAVDFLKRGDVLMLEMQTSNLSGGYGPAELDRSVWLATRAAVDAGITVVAAAGNGARDLDSSLFSFWANWGDSGAIIVGAGTPDANRDALPFSTYGSRVTLQGWGTNVATLGYGTIFDPDENQTYTDSFNGTSSATPIVAGAAAALQSYAKTTHKLVLSPDDLKHLLVVTGDPQGSGGDIGPRPNVQRASESLDENIACYFDLNGDGVIDVIDLLQVLSEIDSDGGPFTFDDVFSSGRQPDFDASGSVDVGDLLSLLTHFNSTCNN